MTKTASVAHRNLQMEEILKEQIEGPGLRYLKTPDNKKDLRLRETDVLIKTHVARTKKQGTVAEN
jgi:hypothetical protein